MNLSRPTLVLASLASLVSIAACSSTPKAADPAPAGTTAASKPAATPAAAAMLELGQPFTYEGLTITVSGPATVIKRADDSAIQLTVQVAATNADPAVEKSMPANFGLMCDNSPVSNGFKATGGYFVDTTVGPNTAIPAGQTKKGKFVGGWIPSAADHSKAAACMGTAVIVARFTIKDPSAPVGIRSVDLATWKLPADFVAAGNKTVEQGGTML